MSRKVIAIESPDRVAESNPRRGGAGTSVLNKNESSSDLLLPKAPALRSTNNQQQTGLARPSLGLYFRKNQAQLSWSEQFAFRAAYDRLAETGVIGFRLIEYRGHHRFSRNGRFLPWHRLFLKVLEQELQRINPKVTLPFWDWTSTPSIPDWVAGWKPEITFGTTSERIQVMREPALLSKSLPKRSLIESISSRGTYEAFAGLNSGGLEYHHNLIRSAIGGTLSSASIAPADPLFWMHLAQIDRIWSEWQLGHPNQNPVLAGINSLMTPWAEREPQTRSIRALGYDYTL